MASENNRITNDRKNYTGLVLAGGRGRRMGGQDKGLINHDGQPLVSYSLQALQPHCQQIYINCNRNQAAYAAFGFPLISDPDDSFPGPLKALAALLPNLPENDLLILPCDTPEIGPAQMQTLIDVSTSYPGHWVYLRADGRDHPLHALLPQSIKPLLLEFIHQSGEQRLMRAIDALPHVAVELTDSLLLNLNRMK
ncbi:molybdenum cofactor guanylyltransferase [Marinobacterium mangrovicola]|uniref:Molybdenum cofactor guanylyltransferase n=1 Tax=Marinobacterium mangrovicola TaxID=1476959 RepID=A0A4R1GNC5_9GAMM|nr:molybdenum cofactor guanylyltransferase [Marinobacterium mangrovicola]TCK05932.1 molybdenum cofactor guanylyltransferase [Marinobacterium mangrovicola]